MDLANKLLIALPNISDPRFQQAVIYICSHTKNGSLGLRVNAPSEELTIGDTLLHLNLPELNIEAFEKNNKPSLNSSIEMPAHLFETPVLNGGPVEHNRGFVLHTKDYDLAAQTLKISNTISMTSTSGILADISIGKGPEQICFAIGYVGWQAAQLEQEIIDNTWLVVDVDDDIVFNHEYAQKYKMSMELLGIKPDMYAALSDNVGHA